MLTAAVISCGCTRDDPAAPPERKQPSAESFWEEFHFPLASNRISSMDAGENGALYVIVGESSYYYHRQVFGSMDSGDSWRDCGFPSGADPEKVRVDRLGNLFVISEDARSDCCIYCLPEGESDWQRIGIEAYSLEFDSHNRAYMGIGGGLFRSEDLLYTREKVLSEGIKTIAISPGDNVYAATDTTLFRSIDRGENWSAVEVPAGDQRYLSDLEVDVEGDIYIIINDYSERVRIPYRSSDCGESWDEIFPASGFWYGDLFDLSVTSDNTIFYSLGERLFRSGDEGENWTNVFSGYIHECCGYYYHYFKYRIIIDSVAEGAIYSADGNGIYRSNDGGESWGLVGLPQDEIRDFLIDSEERIWFGGRYGGVYIADRGSSVFRPINEGLINPQLFCLADNGTGDILAGTQGGVYRASMDDPRWTGAGLDSMRVTQLHCRGAEHMVGIVRGSYHNWDDGVYLSEDGGGSWIYLGMSGYSINCVEEDDAGLLYVGTDYGAVFVYTGEGKVWEQFNGGLASDCVYDLEVDSAGRIYAGTDHGIYVFSKTDSLWVRSLKTGEAITGLLKNGEGDLYAVVKGVVYRKRNGESEWFQLNKSSLGFSVGRFKMDREGYIYVTGNYNSVVYRSIDPR